MVKSKVLCFGELLLRISPASQNDEAEKQPMILHIGGAEANVANALAAWDLTVDFCTVLPDNFMSRHMLHYLQQNGIYTTSILLAGNRIGVYYVDKNAPLKTNIIYDREQSSFTQLKVGEIDWDKVLADISWFHLSAITPGLNAQLAAVCIEALAAAAEKNITTSIDLNYRSNLWKYGVEPETVMPELVQHCDVVMGNIWSANQLLGINVDEHIHDKRSKIAYTDHAEETAIEIMRLFPKCTTVANNFRFEDEVNHLLYYTSLYQNAVHYHSQEFSCKAVADCSGSGDVFMGGLIYGLYKKHTPQQLLNFATAASFAKMQEHNKFPDTNVLMVPTTGFNKNNLI